MGSIDDQLEKFSTCVTEGTGNLTRMSKDISSGVGNITNLTKDISYLTGNATNEISYLTGNLTKAVATLPSLITAVKVGSRTAKALQSYRAHGWRSASFVGNSMSAGLSGTSFLLETSSYVLGRFPLTQQISFPFYAASQTCSAFSDVLDESLGISNTLLF